MVTKHTQFPVFIQNNEEAKKKYEFYTHYECYFFLMKLKYNMQKKKLWYKKFCNTLVHSDSPSINGILLNNLDLSLVD